MAQQPSDAAIGMAALSITQSLLAVLLDRGVLSRDDIEEMLEDAAQPEGGLDNTGLAGEAGDLIHDVMEALVPRAH